MRLFRDLLVDITSSSDSLSSLFRLVSLYIVCNFLFLEGGSIVEFRFFSFILLLLELELWLFLLLVLFLFITCKELSFLRFTGGSSILTGGEGDGDGVGGGGESEKADKFKFSDMA